jgi:hypothetical protein
MVQSMVRRSCVVFVTIAGLMLAGCAVDTTPIDVANFSTNRAATQAKAAYAGRYVLLDDNSDKVVGPILMTERLNQGDAFGFEIDANHVPYAFAVNDRLALKPGRYRWQMAPDAGQTDWNKTNTMTVEVIVGAAVVALLAVSTVAAVRGL